MSAEPFFDVGRFIDLLVARCQRSSTIADALIRQGVAADNRRIGGHVHRECLSTVARESGVSLDADGTRAYRGTDLTPLLEVSANAYLYHRVAVARTAVASASAMRRFSRRPWSCAHAIIG